MSPCKPAAASRRTLESLMEAYLSSDEQAFTELVHRVTPALRGFLAGPHVTRRQTDDLVQDCWLRVHRTRHTYQAGRPLLPWILAIARYARADEYRRMSRSEERHDGEFDVGVLADPRSMARAAESKNELNRLLTALPERQRQVLVLLKFRGMSLEETARVTGSTVGATKQMAHRAYVNLRATVAGDSRRLAMRRGEAVAARA